MSQRSTALSPDILLVAALSTVALAVRAMLAYNGGIWADEGLVLNVVAIPSIGAMIDFLRFHESHPPLFYLMIRGWMAVFGPSVESALPLMLIPAVAIVPTAYVTAKALFSKRAGILAASFVALSPSLAEHSAQVRPYGFLPLFVLVSCYFLIVALERGGLRPWGSFVIATVLLLLIHNWAWLVVGGECVAAMLMIVRMSPEMRIRRAREFFLAVVAIGVLILPWFTSLLYQLQHAGHTVPPLNSTADRIAFFVFGALASPYLMLVGTYPAEVFPLFVVAGVVALVAIVLLYASPETARIVGRWLPDEDDSRPPSVVRAAVRFLLIAPAASLAAALLMSPRSNLLIERCVAMLAPLVLLVVAHVLASVTAHAPDGRRRVHAGAAMAVFLITLGITNIAALLSTSRSNAREVAPVVTAHSWPNDLIIVAPEWYASSFNRYFPASLEQRDYPHAGRTVLLDLADLRTRTMDTMPFVHLRHAVAGARRDGRRVWLVTGRKYITYADEQLPKITTEVERNRYTSVLRVKEAKDLLT
ncbi:MAG: glycosyltransferase family 39 protein, partial [Gemmatimonadaceae bacterium]